VRRFAGWVLAFAIASAGGFAALAAPGSAVCKMACHASGASNGAVCCRLGTDGPVFKICGESRDGVPLPPVCHMTTPISAVVLPRPALAGSTIRSVPENPASHSPEPADPVPLALS
jgi:hypothetical protein